MNSFICGKKIRKQVSKGPIVYAQCIHVGIKSVALMVICVLIEITVSFVMRYGVIFPHFSADIWVQLLA